MRKFVFVVLFAGLFAMASASAEINCPCPCPLVDWICARSSRFGRRAFPSECHMRCHNRCYKTDYYRIRRGSNCT